MTTADAIKTCCAAACSSDLGAMLLGESYHPGRADPDHPARRPARPRPRVLDVAAGRGATALSLAREYAVDVDGVDLAAANVTPARGTADAEDLTDRVRFHVGDAERLPFDDSNFDAVVCECALCTFPARGRPPNWGGCCGPAGGSASPTSPSTAPVCPRC